MTAVIFGATGQDGYYLDALLRARGIEPIGVSRSSPVRSVDVARFEQVDALLRQVRPAYVFHLAATSTTRHEAIRDNFASIADGTLNVLEAVKLHCPAARVFIAGSGLQFENRGAPITEGDAFQASSGYAAARIAAVYTARYYRTLGIAAYVGYLFHHESPRRGPQHVSRMIANSARRVASGESQTIELGDLSVIKEWTFAGDVVRAMLELVSQDAVHECVIGSGEGHSIEEWVSACFRCVGKPWQPHVRIKQGFRAEYPYLVSAPVTLHGLGWRPQVDFEQLAAMMVADRS